MGESQGREEGEGGGEVTRFQDGPAAGKTLMLKRAPIFPRVVVHSETGEVDALDQVDDSPRPGETCHAYILTGRPGSCHINRGGGRGGFYPVSEYRLVAEQPGQNTMRDLVAWRAWTENHAHLIPEDLRNG